MINDQTATMKHWGQRLGLAMVSLGFSLVVSNLSLTPQLQGMPQLEIGQVVLAQAGDVSDDEVMSYAAAVLQMDTPRTEAYTRIKDLLSQANADIDSVDLTCTNNPNLSGVPRSVRNEVRTIVISYCNQAVDIVEASGLSAQRFNQITRAHPEDEVLSERIRTAMIELQQQAVDE